MFPLPTKSTWHNKVDPRVWKAEACLWWLRRLAPGADSVYPMRARTPHECVAIHTYTLMSEEFVSTGRIPTYEAFLHAEGQAQRPPPFVAKSPSRPAPQKLLPLYTSLESLQVLDASAHRERDTIGQGTALVLAPSCSNCSRSAAPATWR
jgi:hypothetical protein